MTRHQRQQIDMFPDSPGALQARADEALALRCRIEEVLRSAAAEIRPCKACRTQLFFVPSAATGKKIPYEANGLNHFKTCPKASEFSKSRKGTSA